MHWDNAHNRLAPNAGPENFKTFERRAPLSSHWRKATCEEVLCDDYVHGFVLTIDLSTDLGQRQYDYVKHDGSRSCSIHRSGMNMLSCVYRPGNAGFKPTHDHRIPIGRPAIFLVAEGDFRGNPRGIPVRVHRTGVDWADEFATHQDKVVTLLQRG